MKFDRESSLRSAERAVQTGRLDQAIAEYARIVEHQARDFNSANTLGDLYARAGQTDSAIAQYLKIAEHFLHEGFLPKASALFKKVLKIRPDDEQSLLRLGEIAAKQGLLADARSSMNAVAAKRRARGDDAGADDILIALADLDAGDVEGRMQAARMLAARGQGADAAGRLRNLAVDLLEKERADEAIDVLRETVHLVPSDRIARKQLIALLHDLGQGAEAEVYLTRDVADDDPAMLLLVAKAELEAGRYDEGREDIRRALAQAPAGADVMAFIRQVVAARPEAAFIAAEALADAAIARRQVGQAVEALTAFLEAVPGHVAGALRFVEICLEEGLDDLLPTAQAALADAYIASGETQSGRVMAEDLALADAGGEESRARLVRAYAREGVADPEAHATQFLKTGDGSELSDSGPEIQEMRPVPDFEVYVYDQPSPPLEPAVADDEGESEDEMIARLLAEEASRDDPKPGAPAADPEIDLTSTLDALDAEPAAEQDALHDGFDGGALRNRAGDHERAEADYEEAELAGALGQIDDAVRLYGEASTSPAFRFRAATALARLLRNEGRDAEAIEWLERASEVPPPDRDAGFALMYDLGDMLEQQGETMRALAIFMELQAEAGDYRGIAPRVERLARAEIGG